MRITAIYDLFLLVPFSIFPQVDLINRILLKINSSVGGQDWPVFSPVHALFVGMFGVLGLTWVCARIFAPTLLLGRLDGFARLAFAALFVTTAEVARAPILYWLAAPELLIGAYLLCARISPVAAR